MIRCTLWLWMKKLLFHSRGCIYSRTILKIGIPASLLKVFKVIMHPYKGLFIKKKTKNNVQSHLDLQYIWVLRDILVKRFQSNKLCFRFDISKRLVMHLARRIVGIPSSFSFDTTSLFCRGSLQCFNQSQTITLGRLRMF